MTTADAGDRIRLVRGLFPDLAAELDGALAATGGAADDFDAWLDGETALLRSTAIGSAAFADVLDAGPRERFERAFAAARTVASWLGLEPPQPEAFAAAGVDLGGLGAALAVDPTLVPVPAPHGLGVAGWRRLFERAAEDDGPLAQREGGSPLVLASEAEREFAILDRTIPGVPVVRDGGSVGAVGWTLRLVPAGLAPAVLGLSFEHGPHATLPEMLMLQLMRAVAGEPLVDARSFTWLAGALADGRLAARHVYDAAERSVRINCREVGNQGPHLGARPPIA
ncbi:hypothetical protein [Leucobacter chironomi]|uniref:hypothetical protein n=1 Tax=Leucobacter chironomi TaxID=491918 RepID=UPI0004A2840C|nr:hypothetical protein [Leucobacter chironomi]